MNITPISNMAMLQDSPLAAGKTGTIQTPFDQVFRQALQNVEETQAVSQQDAMNLALGDVDNIAEIQINSQKAELAVSVLISLRDKALDAYSEIMRINM